MSTLAFLGGAAVKNPPAGDTRQGFDPWVRKSPLEEETAAHSRIAAWEFPRTEDLGRYSWRSQTVGHK